MFLVVEQWQKQELEVPAVVVAVGLESGPVVGLELGPMVGLELGPVVSLESGPVVGLESGPVVVPRVGNRLAMFHVRTSNQWVDSAFDLIHSLPS